MKVLLKEELRKYGTEELVNLYELSDRWYKQDLISKEDKEEIKDHLKKLNQDHHTKGDFTKNFEQLFSKMDKGFFDADFKLMPQALDRANMGAYFSGFETVTGLHIFTETAEMGITVMALEKEMNNESRADFLLSFKWLIDALNDPENAINEMNYIRLQSELNNKPEAKNKFKI